MTVIKEVYERRATFAAVLRDEEYDGIRFLVENLYPDSAHFIYELLQNAEDTGATEARFTLNDDALVFEHNGRPFADRDVWAITNIGKGTKAGDQDSIGRFGLGFKAVFAYTETPRIWSPTYSFEIVELVLPREIPPEPSIGKRTRFEFPFNNRKKTAIEAYSEILAGLNELAETTLLFLRHLESIAWSVDGSECEVLRVVHSEHHIEILKQMDSATTSTSHFLLFSQPVDGMTTQRVSIAFDLAMRGSEPFDAARSASDQMRVAAASPGRVAVFFPADRETSGLRFHLHAPFVPELSRASIKDTPANLPLLLQLSQLAARSLHVIRDLGLLTGDFMGVLPNPLDLIPNKYGPIRSAIVTEMNEQSLVPTHVRGFAPARTLVQASAALKDLVTEDDFSAFGLTAKQRSRWALSAAQKNSNADRFLAGLDISEWDVDRLVGVLKDQMGTSVRMHSSGQWTHTPNEAFMAWFQTKPDSWHQKLYALLFQELGASSALAGLTSLMLVRRSDGAFGTGPTTFFPTAGTDDHTALPLVAEATYTSGRSKAQQESAKKFLSAIGVREVSERDEVVAILQKRYTLECTTPRTKDLLRFVKLVESAPDSAALFKSFCILPRVDGAWVRPTEVFLDAPYVDSGLSEFYARIGSTRKPLAGRFAEGKVSSTRTQRFAEAVGAEAGLRAIKSSCSLHPKWRSLSTDWSQRGVKWTKSATNEDWTIDGLEKAFEDASQAVSRAVWRAMCDGGAKWLRARFRPNQTYKLREEPSRLVLALQKSTWIPQSDGKFVRPADARPELLPEGFPYDAGDEWLAAVGFGASAELRTAAQAEKDNMARSLGLPTGEGLARVTRFSRLSDEEQEQVLREFEHRNQPEFPDKSPQNPSRRQERVEAGAIVAPERVSDSRFRAVSTGLPAVKRDADHYLVEQYTNADKELVCQICKKRMPFTLANGSFFFESVEFLVELERRHYQNYLALCPNHAAMFRHANERPELMNDMLLQLKEFDRELEVILASEKLSICFTGTHLADLRALVASEEQS